MLQKYIAEIYIHCAMHTFSSLYVYLSESFFQLSKKTSHLSPIRAFYVMKRRSSERRTFSILLYYLFHGTQWEHKQNTITSKTNTTDLQQPQTTNLA